MSVDLRLRYTIDGERKTLLLAIPNQDCWQPLATIALNATRDNPDAEGEWRELLGNAIEAAAIAAQETPP